MVRNERRETYSFPPNSGRLESCPAYASDTVGTNQGVTVESDCNQESRYPLLASLLAGKGLRLEGTYTNRDVAEIFGVAVRTIQQWVKNGKLKPRDLPGRGKFLSPDLEDFLRNSGRDAATRQGADK